MNKTSNIEVPISVGELIDKISILMVKKQKVTDEKKLTYVKNELEILNKRAEVFFENTDTIENLNKLISVNSELWDVEDEIRDFESKQKFEEGFVETARKVYKLNDARFELKNRINEINNSTIREVKNYKKY